MNAVAELAGNAPELGATSRYAAILGLTPSQGARSPALWNAVFEASEMDVRFHPLDVTPEALAEMVAALLRDDRFVGGSVTMPHKTDILPLLDEVEPLAARIGAVNALYRRDGRLVGTNTDGAGALASLLETMGISGLGDRTVLLMGTGGAGKAVACYVADDLGPGGRLILANRTRGTAEQLAARLGGKAVVAALPPGKQHVAEADILVNCTSVGFATPHDEGSAASLRTPLDPGGDTKTALDLLAAAKPGAVVFDVIYQPPKSALLALAEQAGLRTLNGLGMNLEQAVIAFCKAFPDDPPAPRVRDIMASVP